ncbi:hypothetical protein SAMN04488516_1105 [Desulfonauticus submarinus]|uniref:Solute:sodium symporter small subunit n=1 Tax=Desulfonauticus submarinus TaxID=206665 RepID=A0A1H0EYZ9_9BACT|nr:hypothetical protein [Desulfonauticus submarinus]SDN87519.1 hypothetical protein SAMN04488516_1105 [Desulfonauticus submarinus]
MNATEKIRKKQLRFALKFGVPYILFIILMYLVVYLGKDWIVKQKIFSLPLHYFLVAVLIYPITWIIFGYYVRKANQMEDEIKKIGG